MRQLEIALWHVLNGDTTLAGLATGGTYQYPAPQETVAPFVVFQPMMQRPMRRLAGSDATTHAYLRTQYQVKGITESRSKTAGDAIAERIAALLDDGEAGIQAQLAAAGFPTLSVLAAFRADVVDYPEPVEGGSVFWHIGGVYEILVQ